MSDRPLALSLAIVAMAYQFAVLNVEPGYAKGSSVSLRRRARPAAVLTVASALGAAALLWLGNRRVRE